MFLYRSIPPHRLKEIIAILENDVMVRYVLLHIYTHA